MAAAAWLRAPGSPCHHGKRSFCRQARASERFARVEHSPSRLEREYSFRHAEFGGHDGLDLRHGSQRVDEHGLSVVVQVDHQQRHWGAEAMHNS